MAVIADQTLTGTAPEERRERTDIIDFKMVTFSLAGKEYGIDIMNVKEIAKAGKFTFVPNAAPFLRGVYNLRGDIIPVIDLRVFFHLPAEKKGEESLESMLILRVDDHIFGVIVDNIDKVVGINSSTIQPPHPIFGDINIKYIRGVVENTQRLYIILDVVRIFAQREEEKPKIMSELPGSNYVPLAPSSVLTAEENAPLEREVLQDYSAGAAELQFVKESLFALKRFATSSLNEAWVASRFVDWSRNRKGTDLQVKNLEEAEEFLSTFYSPCSQRFWTDDYAESFMSLLPDTPSKNIPVWNPGCGKGYETWSLACILRKRYPDAHIKIWANDNDLLAISNAPNMVFELEDIPEYCREFMVKGKSAYSFDQSIRDSVLFEYHDVLNANPFPELDLIVARDLLSFLGRNEQARVFEDFSEKLKNRGMIVLGANERPTGDQEWRFVGTDAISALMPAE